MLAYAIRRILILIPVLLGVSVIVFLMLHLTPGDPAELLLGERATNEALHEIREHLGLNEPLYVQYGMFLKRLMKGDLGETIRTRQKVWIEIKQRFPATIELAVTALFIACLFGITLGIISATKQYSIFDYASMLAALTGVSMPIFWLGLVLMLIFSVNLGWLPLSARLSIDVDLQIITNIYTLDALLTRNWVALKDALWHLIMPAVTAKHHSHGDHRQNDAVGYAGCAASGLYQNRQSKRTLAIQGGLQARSSKCPDSGRYHRWSAVRRHPGRRHTDRIDFCLAGCRKMDVRCRRTTRLYGHSRGYALYCRSFHID